MQALRAIIYRDLLIAVRSGGAWLHGLIFFTGFLTLSAIAMDGKIGTIKALAPSLIWLSLILSLLLSFDQLFQSDSDDGNLEHINMSDSPMFSYVFAKCVVHWLLTALPLLIFLPFASMALGLSITKFAGLFFAILLASPALICYGAFSSACLVGYKSSGLLLILLTIPLLVPVLIFGINAGIRYETVGLGAVEFQALAGLSLIAAAIGIPAATAALNSTME